MIINNRLLFLLSFQYWPLFLLIICPLFVSIPCKRIHNSTLRIGFLSSFRYGLGKIIAGAVPLAIQNLNSDKKILANHNLSFTVAECGKPNTYACIKKMTEIKDEVLAFIGPDESCASEALVAAAWNIPLISYKCIDQNLSNKTIYPTFARTLPPSSKISKSVISLLKYFKWNKIVLIVSENQSNKQVQESLTKLAHEQKIQITQKYYLPDQYISRYKQNIDQIIDDSHTRTRIYILLTDTFVLVDFIRSMQRKKLLETGLYAIVSVEEEVFYSVKTGGYLNKQYKNLRYKNDDLDLRGLLIITPSPPLNVNYSEFQNDVLKYNRMDPFNIPYHKNIAIQVPIYGGLLYDAVTVIAEAFHRVIENHGNIHDGITVVDALKNLNYKSILGFNVHMDQNGDAEGNYTLLFLETINKSIEMQIVGSFHQTENDLPVLRLKRKLKWYGNGPVLAEPLCGFNNELCENDSSTSIVLGIVFIILLITVAFFIFKHYHYEYKLTKVFWKIDIKDVVFINTDSEHALQNIRNTINFQSLRQIDLTYNNFQNIHKNEQYENLSIDIFDNQRYAVGVYKGSVVFVKRVCKKSIDLTRNVRKELIQMREMRHENINLFIGAIVDPPNIAVMFVYCARGNLEDVLRNKDINLDNMFVASLVADLIKGMIYLHDSDIVSHGNLKPSNCLIDSRWVLQISDYGLHEFKSNQDLYKTKENQEKDMLWKAPELLKNLNASARGSQKGDVYSFALILYEIILRKNPFEEINMSNNEILHRIINPKLYGEVFRPKLKKLKCSTYIIKCIEECWKEEPDERPDFRFINIRLREMQAGLKPNIFDNMIAILEKYSYNLESLVQERTIQLLEEKKKTENLLLRMLPKSAAEQLKRGEAVEAEYFDCVTIYFSDIVGFTELSAMSTPIQVVNLLNDLYTCFDSIIGNYDVYKVETIGDAYMVVSGLPIRNSDKHAGQIASMALHLLKEIFNFEIAHRPGEYLKLRIGIHSGSCVAGVVGLKMPRYCLFGDTVNVASRMESSGEAHKIHVSYSCKQILDKLGGYVLEERGLISIKGKGQMRTYWLHDRLN